MRGVDVAIIGAGAAGLSAARELSVAGVSVAVVEGRDRIGGRIFTRRDPRVPVPVELGAEFVHGAAPEVGRVARAAGLAVLDLCGGRFEPRGGRLAPLDGYLQRVDRVMRKLAAEFVQGFHAADLERISARSLAEGGSPGQDPTESLLGRVAGGYDRVPEWLARGIGPSIHLSTTVERVEWEPGGVALLVRSSVDGRASVVDARAAIVTVPIGVLNAAAGEPGAITFSPDVGPIHRASARLAMGAVARIAFWFTELPWDARGVELAAGETTASLAFLQTHAADFPVWWSAHPARVPFAVAWSGGPPAAALSGLPLDEARGRALRGLAGALGISPRTVERRVVDAWTHDWQADPFSRGAYSYARVGGSTAGRSLARPVARTLFFAGEATDTHGRTGTVDGAIASGRRAAGQVLRALRV